MARKFLYVVACLIVLTIAAAFAWRLYGDRIVSAYFVPTAQFEAQPAPDQSAYADLGMWYSRPGKRSDPALWAPTGYQANPAADAELFFIHPTSFIDRSAWNMPIDNPEANWRARIFIRSQASAFNDSARIWAPRYRQATFGAFLTTQADADRALDLAYRDVAAAFDEFLKQIGPDKPIILAGHSQGSLHLTRLLRDKVAGTPLARRIVAAYAVGWPISLETDLDALGLPACERADQANCVLSWQSFAEPADPKQIIDTYDATTGFNGQSRRGSNLLCTNPLTGTSGGAAPASGNLGTLFPNKDLTDATIEAGRVPARCSERGFLLIGEPLELGPYVLPGNNFHVFDYPLFWANVREDARRRLAVFQAK